MKSIKINLPFNGAFNSERKFKSLLILCLSGSLILGSCRKKEEPPEPEPDTEQSTMADNNLAENSAADIESMGSQASENSALTTFKGNGNVSSSTNVLTVAPCATVTTVLGTKIFTVDFGTTGCMGKDGRTRKGMLIFNYSGSASSANFYRNPGFNVNVTSQNYSVDGNQVNINSKTITNTTPSNLPTGVNPGTNLTWSISANITITKAGGGTVTWICNRTKELINTNDTNCYKGQFRPIDWTKAKVKLNGSSSGTNAQGENYSATATNLVRDFNCSPDLLHPKRHPFISGTLSYTPGTRHTRLVDYGNGACDLNATVTINGQVYNIVL
jgi:hypothetical protein